MYVNILHKHLFGFHKSGFVKLPTNLEEKLKAGKNWMNKKKNNLRSSCSQVLIKIGVLKNFGVLTGKHQFWSLFIDKVVDFVTLSKKRLWHRWFSCEYSKTFNSSFLHRTPLVAASVIYVRMTKIEDHRC